MQELEDLRSGNKLLKEEVTQLSADKSSLQAQADSRSNHCMTLISENKRLLAAVSAFKARKHRELCRAVLV